MNNQFYNLSQPSKRTIEKEKKNILAAETYLKEMSEKRAAREQEKILNEKASLMTNAYYSNASSLVHSKRRTQSLTEEIKYANTAPTVAMTELVSELVESALLFDTDEYAKYYPNYQNEIRETVRGLLESSNSNLAEAPERTQILLAYIEESLPTAKEGKYLSEADITRMIKQEKPAEVEAAINSLTGDVSNRVANLVEKEQKRVDKINKELGRAGVQDKIEQTEDEVAPVMDEPDEQAGTEVSPEAQELIAQIQNGTLSDTELEQMIQRGEVSPETIEEINSVVGQAEAMPQEVPEAQGDEPVGDDIPSADAPVPSEVDSTIEQRSGKSIHIGADGTMGITMPNGQLALNQDGSMDIQLMESNINLLFEDMPLEEQDVRLGLLSKERELSHGDAVVARKRFDPEYILGKEIGLKSAIIKPLLLSLIPYIGPVIGGVSAAVNRSNNEHLLRSEAYKDLKNAVSRDPQCREISNKINKELMNREPNKVVLKDLRNSLIVAINEVRKRVYNNEKGQLKEFSLVRETPRCGLIECLAVNEAMNVIKEGKEYNSEACISNALLFVTITEAMSELGLLEVNERTYEDIAKRAGGTLNEVIIRHEEEVGTLGYGKKGKWGVITPSGDTEDPTSPRGIALQRRRKQEEEKEAEEQQKAVYGNQK